MIPYDASIDSLLHPQHLETVFRPGQACSTTQLGVGMAHLAYFSFAAAQRPRLQNALAAAGFTRFALFSQGPDTQAFVARRDDGTGVVAFRGTQPESLEDIGVDLSFGLVPWSGRGRVHEGFRLAFEAVRQDLEGWMRDHDVKRERLLVCGHSLGAALATLAAAQWRPAHLVTIGSPRVGDREFAGSLAGTQCERIFNCCDLVARVPPRVEYEHVEPSFFIDSAGSVARNPGALRVDLERHLGRAEFFLRYAGLGSAPSRDLADHAPINYLRACFP